MLLTCVRMEHKKLRHSHLWLVFMVIPLIPTIMGTANYLQNLGILKSEWYSLWTQCSLFYSNFFYGPLIGLYCAYIWRVEHLNHNWNQLMTMPVPVWEVLLGKLCLALECTVLLQLWVWVLYFVAGRIAGLQGMPPFEILVWLLRGSIGGMGIAALQLVLAMVIRSFAVPVAMALLGSIIGFLLSNGGYGLFWPYSLMLMGMNANKDTDMVGNLIGFGVSTVVFLLLFAAAGIWYLKKKDIAAA